MRTTITLAILAAGVARASIIYGPTQQSLSVDLYAARPETPLVPHGQFTDGASNNTATDWSDTVTGKIEYTEFDSINYIGSATASSQSTFGTDSNRQLPGPKPGAQPLSFARNNPTRFPGWGR